MRLIDEQNTRTSIYGYRRMTVWSRAQEHAVNPKRVLQLTGLEANYIKPFPLSIENFYYFYKVFTFPASFWELASRVLLLSSRHKELKRPSRPQQFKIQKLISFQ